MKTDKNYVKIDSRNRITLPKNLIKDLAHIYKIMRLNIVLSIRKLFSASIYEKDGNIILEPVMEVPQEERWLFEPQNKELVQKLKKALEQEANITIDLDDLEK